MYSVGLRNLNFIISDYLCTVCMMREDKKRSNKMKRTKGIPDSTKGTDLTQSSVEQTFWLELQRAYLPTTEIMSLDIACYCVLVCIYIFLLLLL